LIKWKVVDCVESQPLDRISSCWSHWCLS